uniref:Secologanin synthase n=1 Tax=Anthurium amnicola TaxID=1678845 RepID=A0A1D1Y4S9_9ARAE
MRGQPVGFLVACALCFALLYAAARAWWAVWWRPRSLERQLRRQGIPGTTYRLLLGDVQEYVGAMADACSKPIPLGHRIPPRADPFMHRVAERYGKMSFAWMGTTPRLMVRDTELVKDIYSHKDDCIQKPPLNPLIKLLARGLSILEGETWALRRKLITPAFHVDKLKGMVPAFFSSCEQLIGRWEKLVGSEGSSCELDVWPEFQRLTGDVISKTAFGSSYEEGKRIFQLQQEQGVLVMEAARAVYIPGSRFIPTPKNRRRMYLDHQIKSMLRDLIRMKEAAMEKGGSDTDDLLGLLLQSARYGHRGAITVEDVIEECKLFYFAGHETTSVWLTWAMVALSMHQDWQQRAREEVLQACGSNPPDIQTMNQLRIVSMVLNEVLRLYPPVIAVHRHTIQEVKLGGKSIPAGVDMVLPTLLIHHDPDIWGDDAEEFNPERFSQGISKAGKDQNAFFPFGWGPRICLGQSFAMMEAKMALSMILQRFSFELSPSYAHAPYAVVTLQPQYGAQLILRKI